MNPLDLRCSNFHEVLSSLPHLTLTLICYNKKASTLSERKYHIISATFLVFIDVGENLVMADDVTTPSNPLVSLVEKEELEEALLDVNVSQRLREEEPSRRVVRTQVDRSTWDRRLFPNPHALAIYYNFLLLVEPHQKGSKNVNVKTMMFVFIVKFGFSVMAIIIGCEAQSTPFPWSIELNT
jgi:hypothetical protein